MLNFSFASVFMALAASSLILVVLSGILAVKKIFIRFGLGSLGFLAILMVSRILFPFELPITTNIYWPTPISRFISWYLCPQFFPDSFAVSLWDITVFFWMTGFIAALIRNLRTDNLIHKYIQTYSEKNAETEKLQKRLEQLLQDAPVKKEISLLTGEFFQSPFVYQHRGRYWILIPKDFELSDAEKEIVLKHELFHIRHHDLTLKRLIRFIKMFYWWNPLGRFLEKKVNLLLELRVDTSITHSKRDKANYMDCLLKMAKHSAPKLFPASGISFAIANQSILTQRFRYLTTEKTSAKNPKNILLKVSPILLCMFLYGASLLFIFEASYMPPEIAEDTTPTSPQNTYIIINENGLYDVYFAINDEKAILLDTTDSLQYYNDECRIYESYEEFENEK